MPMQERELKVYTEEGEKEKRANIGKDLFG